MSSALRGLLSGLLVFVAAGARAARPPIIYGDDDRRDIYAVEDPAARVLARSVGALVESSSVVVSGSSAHLLTEVYGEAKNLVPTERFYEQPKGAVCSGALIAPDLFLTAAHCIDATPCEELKIVFDYAYISPDQDRSKPPVIPAQSVYECADVVQIGRQWLFDFELILLDKSSPKSFRGKPKPPGPVDYALLRLNRPVADRSPLVLNKHGGLKKGASVFTIGHPWGLPAKWTGNAKVRSVRKNIIMTDLDAYVGNSGSPVFNAQTKQIEGILCFSTDFEDFVPNLPENLTAQEREKLLREKGSGIKMRSKIFSQDRGDGNGATKIQAFAKELEAALSSVHPSFDGAGKRK